VWEIEKLLCSAPDIQQCQEKTWNISVLFKPELWNLNFRSDLVRTRKPRDFHASYVSLVERVS